MKRLIPLVLIVFAVNPIFANGKTKDELRRVRTIQVSAIDSLNGYNKYYQLPDEDLNDLFVAQIDSLVNSWYVQNAFVMDSVDIADMDTLALLPDSVYIQRLQSIDSFVDLSYNETVKNFIGLYTLRKRNLTEVMLGLASYYFPIFEEALDKYNLPMELKYLSIIESALNPTIRSRANAVGLWQFMYGTGKMLKLEINTFVDERCDPVKSTEAAAKYLSDLYKIYQNWHLVIAAYNCGPGNVKKAIQRSGGAHDYWSIYYKLPRETRGYVPAFIAAAYVMEHYQKHNLQPHYPDFPIVTDTLTVRSYLHFKQVSDMLQIPIEQLRSLNPQYRRDIIPGKEDKAYILKIPVEQVTAFIDKEDSIYAYKREEFFPNNSILVPKSTHESHIASTNTKGMDKIYHTVKSGDTPGAIAASYNVHLTDLRNWNNIRRNMIRVGQKLVIYKAKKGNNSYASTTSVSTSQTNTADGDFDYYTVRRGDNLYTIARRYPGISNKDIIKVNGLSSSGSIFPGQKLKIPRRA